MYNISSKNKKNISGTFFLMPNMDMLQRRYSVTNNNDDWPV